MLEGMSQNFFPHNVRRSSGNVSRIFDMHVHMKIPWKSSSKNTNLQNIS